MRHAMGGSAIEIAALFEESVLSVVHVSHEEGAPRAFTVGQSKHASFVVGDELLRADAFPIVRATRSSEGAFEVLFTAAMTGDVTVGEHTRTLEALVQQGHAQRADVEGAFAWTLPAGASCKLDLGNASFLVSSVTAPARQPMGFSFDWREQLATGGVAVATALFLLMIFSMPPDPKSLSLDAYMAEPRFAHFTLAPAEEKPALPDPKATASTEASGGKGRRAIGESGVMGTPKSKSPTGLHAEKGPKDNPDPHLAKELAQRAVATSGIIGVMTAHEDSQIASIWGRNDPLGLDAANVMGGLKGTEIGASEGGSAFGMFGKGHGGGGDGQGTIGSGKLSAIGKAGGGGDGGNYGSCGGAHCGLATRTSHGPVIDQGIAHTIGDGLDKEIIRRVVRQHINEVKFCYEQQLLKKHDLTGRIGVHFMIGGTGTVLSSVVESSTMHDAQVESCVAGAVKRWEFPKPAGGGLVSVSYPFGFKAAGE